MTKPCLKIHIHCHWNITWNQSYHNFRFLCRRFSLCVISCHTHSFWWLNWFTVYFVQPKQHSNACSSVLELVSNERAVSATVSKPPVKNSVPSFLSGNSKRTNKYTAMVASTDAKYAGAKQHAFSCFNFTSLNHLHEMNLSLLASDSNNTSGNSSKNSPSVSSQRRVVDSPAIGTPLQGTVTIDVGNHDIIRPQLSRATSVGQATILRMQALARAGIKTDAVWCFVTLNWLSRKMM